MSSEVYVAPSREVSSLSLGRSIIDRLCEKGFRLTSDLKGLRPLDLVRELCVSTEEALEIIRSVEEPTHLLSSSSSTYTMSANEVSSLIQGERYLITFSRAIDSMLGGGVPVGQITEFVGLPGVGKTQLCIQLAVDVQIPVLFKGLGGEAVYIDTEGSFMAERAAQVCDELSEHLKRMAVSRLGGRGIRVSIDQLETLIDSPVLGSEDKEIVRTALQTNRDFLLKGIHVFRVHDQTELLAIIQHMNAFLETHAKVRLIVIDSIAFHFRQDLQETSARARVLSLVAQRLNQSAFTHNTAIVLTNHMTTKIDKGTSSSTVPALGELWFHSVTNRLILKWRTEKAMHESCDERVALLVKSSYRPCAEASYIVCEQGVRDYKITSGRNEKSNELSQCSVSSADKNDIDEMESKRLKFTR